MRNSNRAISSRDLAKRVAGAIVLATIQLVATSSFFGSELARAQPAEPTSNQPGLSKESVGPPPALVKPIFLCPAIVAGYSSCNPILGPATESGEDLKLGYDINAASGNLFLTQSDIHVYPGDGPQLQFERYYNSQAGGIDLGIGANWSHTYSWHISSSGPGLAVVADTGRVIQFSQKDGTYIPMAGEFGSLTASGNSWIYTTKHGVKYNFDPQGRLTSIAPPDDGPIIVTYASSTGRQIATVNSGSLSLKFAYSASHISSIADPAGSVWTYSYGGQPSNTHGAPAVTELFQNQAQPPAGGQLLSAVTSPIAAAECGGHPIPPTGGDTFYSYSGNQWFKELSPPTYFYGTNGAAELTAYAKTTIRTSPCKPLPFSEITLSIIGMFSYANSNPAQTALLYGGSALHPPDVVSEAAGGIVNGKLVRDVQLQFVAGNPNPQVLSEAHITADVIIGGRPAGESSSPFSVLENREAISRLPVTGTPRLSSLKSTAGVGIAGELENESWEWNSTLTLASHTDAFGHVTSFQNYDSRGNPATIVEAYGTPLARTIGILYHPVLSRPVLILRQSVAPQPPNAGPLNPHTITWDYGNPLTPFIHQIIESGYTDIALSGKLTAFESHAVQFSYANPATPPNTHNEITSIAGPQTGDLVRYAYAASGYLSTEARSTGTGVSLTTNYQRYDPDGRILTTVDPNGNAHNISYDLQGMVIQAETVGANPTASRTSNFGYDLAGDQVYYQTPAGSILSTSYDAAMRPVKLQATAPQGSFAWTQAVDLDMFGKPITARLFAGDGKDEGPGCSKNGSEQFCRGAVYDLFERLTHEYHLDSNDDACGIGCGVEFAYDSNGLLQSRTIFQDPAAAVYAQARDGLNRVVQLGVNAGFQPPGTNLGGQARNFTYDLNDHLTSRTDALGNMTSYIYDDFGRLIMVVNPDAGTWISNYDGAGNLVASTDPLGQQATYQYDALNRRTHFQGLTTASFDDVSYVFDETGAIPGSNGLQYTNTAGRLTSVLAVAQGGNRNLKHLVAQGGNPINTHFNYDYRGWITAEIDERGGDTETPGALSTSTTSYTWGQDHELLSMTYPDGKVVDFGYKGDALDRNGVPLPSEVDVTFAGRTKPIVINASYFPDGQPIALQYGNGSQMQVTRNKRGEVTRMVSGPVGTPEVSETYSYAPFQIGLPTSVAENNFGPLPRSIGEHTNIVYNTLGWMTYYERDAQNSVTQSFSWSYDAAGNRTGQAYNNNSPVSFAYQTGTNWLGQAQPLAIGNGGTTNLAANTYYSDAAGNLKYNIVGIAQGQEGYVYSYNSRHRLSEIDLGIWTTYLPPAAPDSLQGLRQYNYDGLDRLWQRLDFVSNLYLSGSSSHSERPGSGSHQYYYDLNGRIIEEVESLGGILVGRYLVTDHIYLGVTSREVARVVGVLGAGTVTPGATDIVIQYLHQGIQGTIVAIESVDAAGNAWASQISLLGHLLSYGPRGEGIMATEESIASALPAMLGNGLSGANGTPSMDGFLQTSNTCGASGTGGCIVVGIMDPLLGRSIVPGTNVSDPHGWSPYTGDLAAGPGGAGSGEGGLRQYAPLLQLLLSQVHDTDATDYDYHSNVEIAASLRPYVDLLLQLSPTARANFALFNSPGSKIRLRIQEGPIDQPVGALVLGLTDLVPLRHPLVVITVNKHWLEVANQKWPGSNSMELLLAHELGHACDKVSPLPCGNVDVVQNGANTNAAEDAFLFETSSGAYTPGSLPYFTPGKRPSYNLSPDPNSPSPDAPTLPTLNLDAGTLFGVFQNGGP